MGRQANGSLVPWPDECPAFPLNLDVFRMRLALGDKQVCLAFALSVGWLEEANSGMFHSWEDIVFLCENWDGPIVLKGVLSVQDAHTVMDANVDSIVVSTHGMSCPNSLRPYG